METLGHNARLAAHDAQSLPTSLKNTVLFDIGEALIQKTSLILEANQKDIDHAHGLNMPQPLIDRLTLNIDRIKAMQVSLNQLCALEDPVGIVLDTQSLENGLQIEKITVPLGVIGIIYEARPNVTVDAFALCFKAGNAVVLKGGKEAIHTNTILESIIQSVLDLHNLNPYIIQLIKATDRASTLKMMKMHESIDVLIPRGSANLIRATVEHASIPVIETGSGNCHIYLDESLDESIALSILENAKLQRLGVCNAAESLVIHSNQADHILPKILDQLDTVTFYGDPRAQNIDARMQPATEEDFYTEYLAPKMSVAIVDSLDEAIKHINKYNTKHSESIITTNMDHAETFLNRIDAACVYVNASTRFTDGFEMGLGAEIGISTQKLHARGPMGLKELTSYKYKIRGAGQIR